MKAQFNLDILIATTDCLMTDGIDITDIDIPVERIRLVDSIVVDAGDFDTFYIDDYGQKHLVDNGYQKINCKFADILEKKEGIWSVCDPVKKSRETMSLSAAEARRRLAAKGLLLSVIETINAMPDDSILKINWEYETVFKRLDQPLVDFCTQKLGMIDEQIDELFLLTTED